MLASVTPLHELFGAELAFDRDLLDLDEADCQAVVSSVERYGVAVIRARPLSDEELLRFGRSLGKVYDAAGTPYYSPNGGILRISNVDKEGNLIPADDDRRRISGANRLWHTDSTFVKPRVSITLLNGLIVTPQGGETEFSDTRVAYERLGEDEQEELEKLSAHHTILHSRKKVGFDSWTDEQRETFAGREQPLVQLHEPTGRKALYLASHIESLSGHSLEESAAIVDDLTERATAPELVYSHSWKVGDMVLWDNRCMIHRARPYATDDVRDFRSVRLVDTADL